MIGNSLSFCVKEILEGKVDESKVVAIRCAFNEPLNYAFFRDHTVALYTRCYWFQNKRRAKRIARRLFKHGKLVFTGSRPLANLWEIV